ncbi:LacI family DNA-binding transcriptional regulator [Agreia sp. COWG]|uniref:LacI family DNA-binding transcriptional regulator n=1 Tax=Agreia sp. COWG TaxID=2773266 RepID=UPI0019297B4C|nr:LacI family DNA-binding transcriptional regulator [Agreia sp. COWG]CAD6008418.1 HTH-type transcriptional repressor CytR [Agreia sp. COWG]
MTDTPQQRRRVSLADVARESGVSVAAASFALNGRSGVSEPVRQRVKDAAARLNYTPWTSAVALRTGRSGAVALLIRNLRNPFFLDVINGFDATCAEAGIGVIIGSADYSSKREAELVSTFIAREADGLALAPIGGGSAAHTWSKATGKPLVLINSAGHAPELEVSRVHVDSIAAVRQAVDHLLGLGHRRIALIAAPHDRSADDERVDTFRELAALHGFPGRVIESEMRHDRAVDVALSVLAEPAATRPTAFVTNSDYIASALYFAAAELGLVIGVDLSVVGHDDLSTSRFLAPSLTTIAVDRFEIGVGAARALMNQLDGAPVQSLVSPTTLVARGSTGPAPA